LSPITSSKPVTYFSKWLLICLSVGVLSGGAAAFFLIALEWVTNCRSTHPWLLLFLPLGGLLIGYYYNKYDSEISKGNNLILEAYQMPIQKLSFKIIPSILCGTLITHLFGGSAGREGTAVQMSATIADQFSKRFTFTTPERKTLLLIGISAGFAAVFGTPWAGALFALELLYFSKISFKSILPTFITAFIAHETVYLLGVQHTSYPTLLVPEISPVQIIWVVIAAVAFGLSAMLFSRSTHFISQQFSNHIKNPIWRPVVGGIILVVFFQIALFSKYMGLGIPVLQDAFVTKSNAFDFLLKLVVTALTLGCGFKGGEVTPLFFMGATLGSALSGIIPMPIALLAAVGFVAVFAGATHTPIASTVMAMEIFGWEIGLLAAVGCFVAYLFSGKRGIYSSQIVGGIKIRIYDALSL
jgi:H+/Cl- antiporter ClcA